MLLFSDSDHQTFLVLCRTNKMNYSFESCLSGQCHARNVYSVPRLIVTVGLHAGSTIPVSQMRKLELRELKNLVQSHLAGNCLAENLRVPGSLAYT